MAMTPHKVDMILKVNFKATPAFSAVEEGLESETSGRLSTRLCKKKVFLEGSVFKEKGF